MLSIDDNNSKWSIRFSEDEFGFFGDEEKFAGGTNASFYGNGPVDLNEFIDQATGSLDFAKVSDWLKSACADDKTNFSVELVEPRPDLGTDHFYTDVQANMSPNQLVLANQWYCAGQSCPANNSYPPVVEALERIRVAATAEYMFSPFNSKAVPDLAECRV